MSKGEYAAHCVLARQVGRKIDIVHETEEITGIKEAHRQRDRCAYGTHPAVCQKLPDLVAL